MSIGDSMHAKLSEYPGKVKNNQNNTGYKDMHIVVCNSKKFCLKS